MGTPHFAHGNRLLVDRAESVMVRLPVDSSPRVGGRQSSSPQRLISWVQWGVGSLYRVLRGVLWVVQQQSRRMQASRSIILLRLAN
jgi:hypothetical protein